MLRLLLITALFTALPHFANASDERSWPWVLFGPRIDSCAQLGESTRQRLLQGLSKASQSTANLLPARIWHTYHQQISSKTGSNPTSPSTHAECDAFITELEAPNLSAKLRGGFFLGMLRGAPFDCVLDDADKGRKLLIELLKFYERTGLVYPNEDIKDQLAKMRAKNWKVLNGWDTPHCMDMQRSLSSGELDTSVSEAAMREHWFAK